MSLVKVTCKKCGESSKLDIENLSREEVNEWLNKEGGFSCFGGHVELGKRSGYWVVDWGSKEDGGAPTEEDFLLELKSKHKEVYAYDEISDFYDIEGFSCDWCTVISKETGEKDVFFYTHSPLGKRYYINVGGGAICK